MRRLINSMLVLVITIVSLAVLISVAASAGQKLTGQDGTASVLEPRLTNASVLYVESGRKGDCSAWAEEACLLQNALAKAASYGQEAMTDYLISRGASLGVVEEDGYFRIYLKKG